MRPTSPSHVLVLFPSLMTFGVILLVVSAFSPTSLRDPSSSFFATATAAVPLCNSTGDTTASFSGTQAHPDTIKAVVVWISFADSSSCNRHPIYTSQLPTWFRSVETRLEKYIAWQSYGKMYLDVRTAQQPGADSLKPWNLGKTACYWRAVANNSTACPGLGGNPIGNAEGCVNRNTVDLIASTLGTTYFDDVIRVFFVHFADSFTDTTVGGWSDIRYRCTGCAYGDPTTGRVLGTVQRPVLGVTDGDEGSTKWMLSHEFGHTLGLDHTPASNAGIPGPDNTVYYGRYCNMQFGAPIPINFVNNDFAPWHLWHITANEPATGPHWFESAWFDSISSNTLDVEINDVRTAKRNAVIVDTKMNMYDSEFWLIHHQVNEFDVLYDGDVLAVWHMRNPTGQLSEPQDLDLELATGKKQSCSSSTGDPVSGLDSLECRIHKGHPADLYYANTGPDTISSQTNPNTNDYSTDDYPGTQSVKTGISIHDIHFGSPQLPYLQPYLVEVIYPDPIESPFLYVWKGRNFPRYVNVLAGIGQNENPQGVYNVGSDFLVLEAPLAFDGERYVFKIREDGRSTTYLDKVELRVIDHDPGVAMTTTRAADIMGYNDAVPPDVVLGLPGDVRPDLSRRGDAVHAAPGDTLVLQWVNLSVPLGQGGVILSSSGREKNEMPNEGGLVVERADGRRGWLEVARILPRSTFTDVYLSDEEIARASGRMSLRIRWLDFHALDYVAFVRTADPSRWSSISVSPDSAGIAYGGSRLEELSSIDGSFAVLNPGAKLSLLFPFREPQAGRNRTVVLASTGYYVVPAAELRGARGAGDGTDKIIRYLDRNHPNPFNPTTHILFGLDRGAQVFLGIYSPAGELLRRLYEGPLESGDHDFVWDGRTANGRGVASGVYFYKLVAGNELATGKMLAVK